MSNHTHSINRPGRRRLKIAALEERLGVHRQTIWRWCKAGLLPAPHYLGSERQWFEDEIENAEKLLMARRSGQRQQKTKEVENG